MTKQAELSANSWRVYWFLIFAANLVVPLLLGWPMCRPGGRVGLALAITIHFGIGLYGLWGTRKWGRNLVIGGIPVGLSQVWPFAQIFAGTFALRAWTSLTNAKSSPDFPNSDLSLMGGFVVTSLTGAMLMTAAFLIGWWINHLILELFPRPTTNKPKPVLSDEF